MELFIYKCDKGHKVVITKEGNEIYCKPLTEFIGSELASKIKIEVKEIVEEFNFNVYKIINENEIDLKENK